MTVTEPSTNSTLSPRLQQFQTEVEHLKVSGGKANPERNGRALGAVLMAVGLILGVYAYFGLSHNTTDPLQQGDATVMGLLGVGLTVVGTGIFVVFSLTRYFRYWLVRLIYEQRDQTDRIAGTR
jgi:uncharacterized membrane protein YidH (DUF202 family)